MPQHYWRLTIRLFNVISRILGEGVFLLCRDVVGVFYSPSQFGIQLYGFKYSYRILIIYQRKMIYTLSYGFKKIFLKFYLQSQFLIICMRLNSSSYLYQILIIFCWSIWPIDGKTTLGQTGHGKNCNQGILHISNLRSLFSILVAF